jgi:hypothetical protein
MIDREGGLSEIIYNDKLKVHKDLLKLDMGFDNIGYLADIDVEWSYDGAGFDVAKSPHFETIEKDGETYPIAWCYANADGEQPVCFVVYVGQEGKLRAYIPDDGNNIRNGHSRNKETWTVNPFHQKGYFYYWRMMNSVKNRISVKGAVGSSGEAGSEKGGDAPLTFRQLIQSLRDFGDQYASVMPVAKDAENSAWGIENIWFEDGVLMLGQHDDEGLSCDTIAERIEGCVPSDLLDEVAVVKVGVTYQSGGVNIDVLTKYDEPAKAHNVQSSVVKSCRDNDWFCKWTLKFA